MRVKKLPQILALHLKRFKYMEQMNRFTKLSYRVVFPLELRLFNTVSWTFEDLLLNVYITNETLKTVICTSIQFKLKNWINTIDHLLHILFRCIQLLLWLVLRVMVFIATFHNISVLLWWSVLLVEETGVPWENHRPDASHWQTYSH